ncbi:hypothetical protein ACFX1Z_003594 [Malus domestica]
MLTLETTKPTWRAGRVINELTTSFSECGACQLVGRARPRSKFVDVALGRATDFCVLRLRPRKEHVSASWALEHEDKVINRSRRSAVDANGRYCKTDQFYGDRAIYADLRYHRLLPQCC